MQPELRKKRILDAAMELFIRHGYDKTTIAEVARLAGIGKGSLYLHFDNKGEVLEALFLRELHAFSEAWLCAVMAAAAGGTLGGMYKAMIQALQSNPFMSAVFRRDGAMLGNYLLHRPQSIVQASATGQMTRHEVIAQMQAAGAIRDDLSAKVIARIIDMLAQGMLQTEMAEVHERDAIIEGIGELMDRALTPPGKGASEAGKAVLQRVFAIGRQRFEEFIAQRASAKQRSEP